MILVMTTMIGQQDSMQRHIKIAHLWDENVVIVLDRSVSMTGLCRQQDYFYDRTYKYDKTTSATGLCLQEEYVCDKSTSMTELCIRQAYVYIHDRTISKKELHQRQDYIYDRTIFMADLFLQQNHLLCGTMSMAWLRLWQDHIFYKGLLYDRTISRRTARADEKRSKGLPGRLYLREKYIGAKVVCKVTNHVHPAHKCFSLTFHA